MESSILLSGLVGALVSAVLSYWVRVVLARRSQREAERRVAYFHLVGVSRLVATETIISTLLKLIGNQAIESLRPLDGSFEPSHRASVILAKQVRELTPEKLKEFSEAMIFLHSLKASVEDVKASKFSTDYLSKLPKETILSYSFLLDDLDRLRTINQLWISLFETGDRSWVTAERIYDQLLSVARFLEHARKLATPAEASELLRKQIETYTEELFSSLSHQQKVKAALGATK